MRSLAPADRRVGALAAAALGLFSASARAEEDHGDASIPPVPQDAPDVTAGGAASEGPITDAPPGYDVTAGVDLVTRFLYRGVAFGDQWTLQPTASITTHGFSTTIWASAGLDQRSLRDYVGLTFSYYASGRLGTLGLDVSDWIFTSHTVCRTWDPADPTVCLVTDIAFERGFLGDFANDGTGAHWLDLTASYQGPESFPLKLQLGLVAYGDPDHSTYLGLSYPIQLARDFTLTPEFGVVFGRSAFWYWTDDDPVNVTNCALTLAKTVTLGRGIRMPLSVLTVVNPEAMRVHVVASVGLRL